MHCETSRTGTKQKQSNHLSFITLEKTFLASRQQYRWPFCWCASKLDQTKMYVKKDITVFAGYVMFDLFRFDISLPIVSFSSLYSLHSLLCTAFQCWAWHSLQQCLALLHFEHKEKRVIPFRSLFLQILFEQLTVGVTICCKSWSSCSDLLIFLSFRWASLRVAWKVWRCFTRWNLGGYHLDK